MTGLQFALALAGLLMLAFAAGWAARALWGRGALGEGRADDADRLAGTLLATEAARDEALAAAAAELEAARSALREREAELAALDEGLRHARAEAEALRRR